MKPTINYLIALSLLTIISCMHAPITLVAPIAALLMFNLICFLLDLKKGK